MITRKFIETIKIYFDELNYRETKKLDYEKFETAFFKTLSCAKDLEDAIEAIRMFQYCSKHWNKIDKMFKTKLETFNEYDYEGNSIIQVVDEEEAYGTYYVTNAINKKIKEVYAVSQSIDENFLTFDYKGSNFFVYQDGNYYISYSRLSNTMKLFNKNKKCLCNIVLSEKGGILLKNNHTNFELIKYDDCIGVYQKEYIDSLHNKDKIDTNSLLADIEWIPYGRKVKYGITQLNVYSEVDEEILLLLSAATFLLFNHYITKEKRKTRRTWLLFFLLIRGKRLK